MAVQNFIRTIWSKSILDKLELKTILVNQCHREYEGDVEYARTVKILAVGEPLAKYATTLCHSYRVVNSYIASSIEQSLD